jgi:diguanylate cyclase (GGDEF)-like protein/PAS domain S-box-containing protein
MNSYSQQDLEQALLNCEAEPIHQICYIQPHGLLLVINTDWPHIILQVSQNVSSFFNFDVENLLGKPISAIFDTQALLQIELLIPGVKETHVASGPIKIRNNNLIQDFQARLFESNDLFVLELVHEEKLSNDERLPELLGLMQQGLSSSELDCDICGYFEQIVNLIRSLTGFDRVMAYRFDANWDGEVIAESHHESAESYYGLHFPASDIPPQARRLYTLNYIRCVADILAEPVPVIPTLNPVSGEPLDMTYSNLRSFSPVHIEYLKNMGVQASMSISLLQNGRLWGLVACHHLTAKLISQPLQEASALIGRIASIKLSAIEAQEQRKLINKTAFIVGELLKYITTDSEESILLRLLPELLALLDASGIAMLVEGQLYTYGEIPKSLATNELLTWISSQTKTKVFSCDRLSQKIDIADPVIAAGLLATPVSADMRNCIIWLRKEKLQTVKWAGKSEKAIYTDTDGQIRLSPRKSFAEWTESWHERSVPWTHIEEGVAAMLAVVLTEGLSQKNLMEQALSKQRIADAELRIVATAFESQEGILLTDSNGSILRVNSAFTDITGFSAKEVIGKNPNILKSGRHDVTFYQDMWKNLLNHGVWKGEIWNKRKCGQIYPQHLTITAVKDTDGKIKNYIGTVIDITERKAAQAEIERLAFFDPLTGLPNRRYLIDRLKPALASSSRNHKHGAILFIDLDNFKTLNDTLGHDHGDLLLQQVAGRLGSCIRESDTVARLGGDEFIVMLEDLAENPVDAATLTETVANKILARLGEPYNLAGIDFNSTPSIGVTLFKDPEFGVEDLLKQADIAMYQAKKAGRNTLCFFDPKMQEVILARAALESNLRLAVTEKQFTLYYQLQVNQHQQVMGAEVLIRWSHPKYGLLSPANFIPLAEETGLIVSMGTWVLESVCAQISLWQQEPALRELVIAVNVSPRQFRRTDFTTELKRILDQYAINPKQLKLELTENILVDDIESIVDMMTTLKQFGIQFSLDDFGTGYSSLQYLKRLPLDQLKIDQSFVRDVGSDPNDRAIVRTIIAMAHSLDLSVIAEGVETEQQRELLELYGCLNFQGYLFGKPMPVEQFEEIVRLFDADSLQ